MSFVEQLRAIDPRLPYLLTAALCALVIHLWRSVSRPGAWWSFDNVPSRVKALPAAVIGAVLTAGTTQGLHTLLVDLVFGAFAGVTAVGGHETLRRLASSAAAAPELIEPAAVSRNIAQPRLTPEQIARLSETLAAPDTVARIAQTMARAPLPPSAPLPTVDVDAEQTPPPTTTPDKTSP